MENNKKENWSQAKARLQQEYPELVDSDFDFDPSEDSEKLDMLVEKTKKTREEIRSWLHFMG